VQPGLPSWTGLRQPLKRPLACLWGQLVQDGTLLLESEE
jgi:hypothetical protein